MRLLKIAVIVVSLFLLGLMVLCSSIFILPEFHPTASQQLLRLTDLPTDLVLTPENPGPWGSHDFTIVEQALFKQIPRGASEAAIQTFLADHKVTCTTTNNTIGCEFYRSRFPCRTTVYLPWILDSARQLEDIRITDSQVCL